VISVSLFTALIEVFSIALIGIHTVKAKKVKISMAAKGNCHENALAERVNGILKGEFNLDTTYRTKQHAIDTVKQSIYIYNNYRPHWALDLKTPELCHIAMQFTEFPLCPLCNWISPLSEARLTSSVPSQFRPQLLTPVRC
jgi:hypothetical protein